MKNLILFLLLGATALAQGVSVNGTRTMDGSTVVSSTGSLNAASAGMVRNRLGPSMPPTCTAQGEYFLKFNGADIAYPYVNTSGNSTCAWAAVLTGGLSIGVNIPGGTPKGFFVASLTSGTTDIYTVPAGKRMWTGTFLFTSTGALGATCNLQVKAGGTYYPFSVPTAVGTNSSVAGSVALALEGGETLSVTCTAAGITYNQASVLYDNTASLRSFKKLGLSSGDNDIVTVPANMVYVVQGSSTSTIGSAGTIQMVPDVSRTSYATLRPSGGSTAKVGIAVTGATVLFLNCPITAAAGDTIGININTGTATQVAWVNVIVQAR